MDWTVVITALWLFAIGAFFLYLALRVAYGRVNYRRAARRLEEVRSAIQRGDDAEDLFV